MVLSGLARTMAQVPRRLSTPRASRIWTNVAPNVPYLTGSAIRLQNGTRALPELRLGGPLAPDYLVFRAISQRGKGGVNEQSTFRHLRHGPSSSKKDAVMARPPGRRGWAIPGETGRVSFCEIWVARESQCRKCCAKMDRDGNRYLILEKVAGRQLIPRKSLHPSKHSWQRAERFLNQLGELL